MLRWETKGEKEKSAKTGRKHPLALFPRQIRKRYEKPFVDKWEHESPFRIVSITNSNEAFTSHMTIRMEMEARYGILQLLTKR